MTLSTQAVDVVSVIAGGWSFSQVPQDQVPGYRIAVNDAAFHLAKPPDEIVSMDRQWTEHRLQALLQARIPTYLRRSAVQNLHDKISGRPWINIFDCDNESFSMTHAPYTLNGTNSGMCALNRAYKIATKEVYLFGFDMCLGPDGEKHWYPDYDWPYQLKPGKLREWSPQFARVGQQFRDRNVQLFNVSNRTQITGISTVWLWTLARFNENRD